MRIVAATNKPREDEVKAGKFREDLFYRLNVFTIMLPALKDRREDIPPLIEHLLRTRPLGKTPFTVDSAALAVMSAYDWPGNIRELANVLERAQILAEGNTITVDDLPDNLVPVGTSPVAAPVAVVPETPDNLDGVERRHILQVLDRLKGNKVQAAKALGISRRSLYRLNARHRLDDSGEL